MAFVCRAMRVLRVLSAACVVAITACDSTESKMDPVTEAGSGPDQSGTTGAVSNAGAPATAGGAGAAPGAAATGGGMTSVGGTGGASGSGDEPVAGSAGSDEGMAGSAGTAAAGEGGAGAGGDGEAGSDAGPQLKPKCKRSPDQVIVIGDSYINWITHTFPDDLTREAGEMWRMYAVGGCSLGSGGLCLVPDQLDQAIADDPDIIAGVMTGGGNDILIADEVMFPGSTACKDMVEAPMTKVCQDVVATAIAAGDKLMTKAANAGIRDVIYMFYPHIPGGGFGGMNPNYLLDYALPMAQKLCDDAEERTQGKLRCHFIDLVPVFEDHADWFADDGIHENMLGSAAMAKEVVKVAKENCIAQPESSGCCEP